MENRRFASWVEPVAAELRETRAQIVETAHAVPADAWERPSPCDGWTYKDLLTHLAVGDWVLQGVLRLVTGSEGRLVSGIEEVDAGNAQRLAERRGSSVEELIDEVIAEGERSQELLAQLEAEHEPLKGRDAPMTLGEYLRGFPGHDRRHLDELRAAVKGA